MEKKEIIGLGAEAIIYREADNVLKNRIVKSYRISEIDNKLRLLRMRREAKIFRVLDKMNFPAPKLVKIDEKNCTLEMNYIPGEKLRDILGKTNYKNLCTQIGIKIALLHNAGIIHSDLTTSNMILNKEVYFIDFGLSFFSLRIEDKAVDLHLLYQALESKHYSICGHAFKQIIKAYKKHAKDADLILERLKKVEGRGRHKGKSM